MSRKETYTFWIVVALLAVAIVATVHYARTPRTLTLAECSDIYRHYADSPDVSAAYLKDYRVNDTLTLSATVLQAVTDTGWATIVDDINIRINHTDSVQIEKGLDVLGLRHGDKFSYEIKTDDVIAVFSLRDRYACVLEIADENQRAIVIDAIWDKIFDVATNNQKFIGEE